MHSTVTVDVEAPPSLVFDLARDVGRWPALLPHYLRVRVLARHADGSLTAEMVAVRLIAPVVGLGLPVLWRSRVWVDAHAHQLRFVHLGGATDGMEVTWHIAPTASGCRVSIEHEFKPRVGVWGLLVDRLFVRPIARRTLGSFKAIAEAVAARKTEARRSGRARQPKKSAT